MRTPKLGYEKIQNVVYQSITKWTFLSDEVRAKRHDYFLFDEEDGGWQPKDVNLWDDEDFEDGMKYSK